MQPLEFRYSEIVDVPCGEMPKWEYERIVADKLLKNATQNGRYLHFIYDCHITHKHDLIYNVPKAFLMASHVVDVLTPNGDLVRVKDRING